MNNGHIGQRAARRIGAALVITALGSVASYPVHAADVNYPTRPVRVIVPYTPGGASDAVARILGQKLTETLGQQFVIDNRPGAASALGRELVAKANPDGYTVLIGDSPHTINVHVLKRVPYDPLKDFTAITLLATAPLALVVNNGFPAKSVKEFIAAAQAQPGRINFGSGGNGAVTHLTGELFRIAANVNIVHIPYKSIGLASTDVIGGQVQSAFPTVPGIITHVRGGRVRALAVTGLKRTGALPELPTFEESGVQGMNVTNWFGFFAPAGLPKPLLGKLHGAVLAAIKAPDVTAKLTNLSLDITTSTPEVFADHLKSELERWGKVVKAAGIKAE